MLLPVILGLLLIDVGWECLYMISIPKPVGASAYVPLTPHSLKPILQVVLFGPFLEEAMFRVPLMFPIGLYRARIVPFSAIPIAAVLLSFIFGYLHGNLWNVGLQGFAGLLLSLVFLKSGGYQNKLEKAFFSSFFFHSLNNGLIVLYFNL